MTNRNYNMAALAAAGKRWFAKPPEGFENPPYAAIESFSIYAALMQKSDMSRKVAHAISAQPKDARSVQLGYAFLAQKWIRENGPTLFVSEQILDACENTNAFKGVEGSDIKITYPTGYISLPKKRGFISKQTGDRLSHIWFTVLEPNTDMHIISNEERLPLNVDGKSLFIHGYWEKNPECSSFSLPLNIENKTLLEVINESVDKVIFDETVKRVNTVKALEDEAHDLGLWMSSLVVNLFLIMQSYPQYMDKLSKDKSYRQGFKDRSPATSIIIRPSKSQPVNRVVVNRTDESIINLTGRSVSNHWRRGHWKRQPHGEYWELKNPEVYVITLPDNRKAHMKWIIPIYVGLKSIEKTYEEE